MDTEYLCLSKFLIDYIYEADTIINHCGLCSATFLQVHSNLCFDICQFNLVSILASGNYTSPFF